jgi:hypothetical protein
MKLLDPAHLLGGWGRCRNFARLHYGPGAHRITAICQWAEGARATDVVGLAVKDSEGAEMQRLPASLGSMDFEDGLRHLPSRWIVGKWLVVGGDSPEAAGFGPFSGE